MQNEINHFLQDNDVNSSNKHQSGDKSRFMDDPLWGVKFEQDDDDYNPSDLTMTYQKRNIYKKLRKEYDQLVAKAINPCTAK